MSILYHCVYKQLQYLDILGQSEELELKDLKQFVEKKKCSKVQYILLLSALTLQSCGQLGY